MAGDVRAGRTEGATAMARAGLRAAAVALSSLLAVGGYAAADITDTVPGPLTDEPAPKPFPPLPTAPGAVAAPPAPAVVAGASPTARRPDPAGLDAALRPLLADPALGPSPSAAVVDALTGQVLLDVDAAAVHEPASVAKLLTAAAALHRFGPDHVVSTRAVLRSGSGDAGVQEVVLLAGGDVLLAPDRGDPQAASGRAGLGDLADATAASLVERGVAAVTVTVDDGLFQGVSTGAGLGPGVVAADVANGFVAPMTAVAVDAGRVVPGATAPRHGDPGLSAAGTFAALLAQRGITVTGAPVRSAAPPEPVELGVVSSAPLSEVVGYVLASSDNVAAEALARLVAVALGRPATFAGAGQAVLDEVAALGVATGGLRLADGSGLADGSLLSARVLTDVLVAAASPAHPELRPLYPDLPVAGLTGTLGGRFAGAEAAAAQGRVRAKTGSLTGTTSLAGAVLDADGRLLVFAVLADRTPSTGGSRAVVDRFVARTAACGC